MRSFPPSERSLYVNSWGHKVDFIPVPRGGGGCQLSSGVVAPGRILGVGELLNLNNLTEPALLSPTGYPRYDIKVFINVVFKFLTLRW